MIGEMKIVTSGLSFVDIDAYAGCIAYAELLNLQGIDALAFSSATLNDSVPETVQSWNAPFSTEYIPRPEDTFVLIDVSEPKFVEKFVDINRVDEVIDHHVGHEDFWNEKIAEKANIEFIGAACTQVFEQWQRTGLADQISETSARLLVCGILDNTLNFKAGVTTERDHAAYRDLLKMANLPQDWAGRYFQECESSIFSDIQTAITNDTKVMSFKRLDSDSVVFGQLVLWSGERVVHDFREALQATMSAKSDDWIINIVSIQDGQSFFIVSNDKVMRWAEKLLDVSFDDGLASAGRLWLRKEIVKEDLA